MDASDPLVSPDVDVRDLDGFMLNVERLLASELAAIGTPEECWAALMLWCRAWKQVPGGSLPNDDRILAAFSGTGKRWAKVRDMALRGFVLCSDGRLYHRFLCAEVTRAYERKVSYRERRDADRKRLSEWRLKQAGPHHETPDETRFGAEDTGQGGDRDNLKITPNPAERGQEDKNFGKASPRSAGTNPRARGTNPRSVAAAAPPHEPPWESRCRSWAKGLRWDPLWGPEPDDPKCHAPQLVIEEAVRQKSAKMNGSAA